MTRRIPLRLRRGKSLSALTLTCLAALALLGLCGCRQGFFRAQGSVESRGGLLGSWRSTPQGCSRDSLDGLPAGETTTIATFLWEDPSLHDPRRDGHRATAPDAPLRLEIARANPGYSATVTTARHAGVRAQSAQCSQFAVDTHQEPGAVPEAQQGLGGNVRLTCEVEGGELRANLAFAHCAY